jgi:hypothetical protein
MPMRKFFTLLFHVNTYSPEKKERYYEELTTMKCDSFEAPDHCVENILNFARSYKVTESENVGKIELILN